MYKLPPLVVAHYNIQSTIRQKLNAIAYRAIVQARDIFDLYILSSQYNPTETVRLKINGDKKRKICENIYRVSFEQFRDTALAYLSEEDQAMYNSVGLWDDVKLKVINFIEEL